MILFSTLQPYVEPLDDLLIIYIMSILTFGVYAIDKRQAMLGGKRVPEAVLLVLTFLGGAFGALCAMILFAHKTKHTAFLILVPLFLFLQLAGEIIYRTLLW